MFRLIGLVVSIGIADSANPSTIAPALYLGAGEHAARSVALFTLGVFGVFFVGGGLIMFGPGQLLIALIPHPAATLRYVLEVIAGVVMLVGAALVWRVRGRLGDRKLPTFRAEGKSGAVLGATIAAVEFPTAFPYFAAIAAVVAADVGPLRELLLLVLYNVCFVMPLLAILVTLVAAPDRSERILGRARYLLQKHWPQVLAGLALVAGVFVTLLGVTGLIQGGHSTVAHGARRLRRIIAH